MADRKRPVNHLGNPPSIPLHATNPSILPLVNGLFVLNDRTAEVYEVYRRILPTFVANARPTGFGVGERSVSRRMSLTAGAGDVPVVGILNPKDNNTTLEIDQLLITPSVAMTVYAGVLSQALAEGTAGYLLVASNNPVYDDGPIFSGAITPFLGFTYTTAQGPTNYEQPSGVSGFWMPFRMRIPPGSAAVVEGQTVGANTIKVCWVAREIPAVF